MEFFLNKDALGKLRLKNLVLNLWQDRDFVGRYCQDLCPRTDGREG